MLPLTVTFYFACAGIIISIVGTVIRNMLGIATMPVVMAQQRKIFNKLISVHACAHNDISKLETILQSHTTTLGQLHYLIAQANPVQETELPDLQTPCVVCRDREVTHIIWPCSHLCLCSGCGASEDNFHGKCPMCALPFEAIKRVYT